MRFILWLVIFLWCMVVRVGIIWVCSFIIGFDWGLIGGVVY